MAKSYWSRAIWFSMHFFKDKPPPENNNETNKRTKCIWRAPRERIAPIAAHFVADTHSEDNCTVPSKIDNWWPLVNGGSLKNILHTTPLAKWVDYVCTSS